jgi:carboxypeptidase Q
MIGPRLTGSSNYMSAAEWARQQFISLGLANVHTEEWTIPATWEEKGPATGQIIEPVAHRLHIYSIGWSPSTPPQGVQGEVVYVRSLLPAALDAQKAKLAGKLALVDSSSYGEKPTISGVYSGLDRLQSISPAAILLTGIANGAESLLAVSLGGSISSVPAAEVAGKILC